MTIKLFWHVCMINQWADIVKEQLTLIIRSGLYDRCSSVNIGCVGDEKNLNSLKKIIGEYVKIQVKVYSKDLTAYEFITLQYMWERSQKDVRFYGVYFHTKGVSWPNHEGGKYWRDYMNYYNLSKWKDAVCKLNQGYDTCGVKYLSVERNPSGRNHYSGNFYWFKSLYLKTLKEPLKLDTKDRFAAEFWIGLNKSQAASLNQMFVDYNTKGKFQIPKHMRKIFIHTLAYNLPAEVEKTTRLIYEQNPGIDFKHIICDLGFPINKGNEIPKNIKSAQAKNTVKLKEICQLYGSVYLQMSNIGVSQNWTQIIKHCRLSDEDVIIGADPDERTMDKGWIKAMCTGLDQPNVGMVTLMMPQQVKVMNQWTYNDVSVNETKLIEIKGGANWAMIGFNGRFCKAMGEVPYPKDHPKYGYIEDFVTRKLKELRFRYLFLPGHRVEHTDYELGNSEGAPRLLREWKNQIIFKVKQHGQMDFTKYLDMVRERRIIIPADKSGEIKIL